jgi:hypothetical protein
MIYSTLLCVPFGQRIPGIAITYLKQYYLELPNRPNYTCMLSLRVICVENVSFLYSGMLEVLSQGIESTPTYSIQERPHRLIIFRCIYICIEIEKGRHPNDRLQGPDDRSLARPALFLFYNWQLTARLPINLTCMPLAHGNKAIARPTERLRRLESGRRGLHCQKCSLSRTKARSLFVTVCTCTDRNMRWAVVEKSRGCRIQPRLVMPPLMPDMGVESD